METEVLSSFLNNLQHSLSRVLQDTQALIPNLHNSWDLFSTEEAIDLRLASFLDIQLILSFCILIKPLPV
jgi:hypothetical protein